MMSLLLLILGCPGATNTEPVAPPPSTTVETPPVEAGVVAEADGSYHFSMDEGGGTKGAPKGMAFLFAPGSEVDAMSGALSDGSNGFRFGVATENTSVVCTTAIPLNGPVSATARVKVGSVNPGPQPFMGLQLELRSRDSEGGLVEPPNGRYSTLKVFREASEWQTIEAKVKPPAGAVNGEFCFRFVRSTGVVEVDDLVIRPGEMADATAPVATDADVAPTCPAGCCPCNGGADAVAGASVPARVPVNKRGPAIFPLPIKWEADEGGGKNGAPKGFELIADKNGSNTTVSLLKGKGFMMKTASSNDATVVCSDRFAVSGRVIVKGNVAVEDFRAGEKKNSAFVVELRSFGEDGKLVSPAKVKFQRLYAVQTVLDWNEFSKEIVPPAAAVASRVCFHFADSSGSASLDWLGVYPG